jgi:thioredoxin
MEIDDAAFQQTVLAGAGPVLVKFTAPWCKPCHALEPVLIELSREYAGRIQFVNINADENPAWAAEYGVQGYPTLMLFRGGRAVERILGFSTAARIRQRIDKALGSVAVR